LKYAEYYLKNFNYTWRNNENWKRKPIRTGPAHRQGGQKLTDRQTDRVYGDQSSFIESSSIKMMDRRTTTGKRNTSLTGPFTPVPGTIVVAS